MPRSRRRHPRALGALLAMLALSLVLAACGGGNDDGGDGNGDASGSGSDSGADGATAFAAQVASYELVAGKPQRFIAGVVGQGTGTVVSFGSVDLQFFYLGTREQPVDPPAPKATATATFVSVPGHELAEGEDEPREVRPSEGLGVYEATGVVFDAAGSWGVTITANIDGEKKSANAAFNVRAEPRVPAPGMPALRTENPTIASVGANSAALDSRASASEAVPDPGLHEVTVAQALSEGRPVVLVISTPVFCVSRFCGPITDAVSDLQKQYGDRAAFVHIEVWEDFEAKKINPAAREWLQPGGTGDLQEPWVFLIGRDGIIKDRFDNVAGQKQLEDAVKGLVGTGP